MGTYDESSVGDTFESPLMRVEDETARALIRLGGYTHPLFTDPAYAAASPFGRAPLPGEAVLLLMGGLAEQSGRFDETVVALLGFTDVRFRAPVFPDDEIRVAVEVLGKEQRDGRGVLTMAWRCLRGPETLVESTARMLFRTGAR